MKGSAILARRVTVLMGGQSAERDISLISGEACVAALTGRGYQVSSIDAGPDLWSKLEEARPDTIFNALHGGWGEDGRVQGLLDIFGQPYTHSGVAASSLAMNKSACKAVLRDHGIESPPGFLATSEDLAAGKPFETSKVIKPNNEGSSVEVFIIHPGEEINLPQDRTWLVEEYVPGRELTVSVMNNRALGVTEIIPKVGFYDLDAKYAPGGSEHILPADLPEPISALACEWAETAHRVLGCRGLTRTDFRYDPGEEYLAFLEINTQPGMTSTSLAPEQAAAAGTSFSDLCDWMIQEASCPR